MARTHGLVPRLDERDLTHVVDHARLEWTDLRGARVLITGATGFVGGWLLETLVHANDALGLGIRVTALVREPGTFATRFPRLSASKSVKLHTDDVRVANLAAHSFSHYVHCASASPPRMNAERPDEVVEIIERGTERMLEEAERRGEFVPPGDKETIAEMIQSATMKFRYPQLWSKLTLPKLERELEGVLNLLIEGLCPMKQRYAKEEAA